MPRILDSMIRLRLSAILSEALNSPSAPYHCGTLLPEVRAEDSPKSLGTTGSPGRLLLGKFIVSSAKRFKEVSWTSVIRSAPAIAAVEGLAARG